MKFQKKLTRTEMRNISGGTGEVGAPIKQCGQYGDYCDSHKGGSVGCCSDLVCKIFAFNMGNCSC